MVNWLKCDGTWFTHEESCPGLVIFLHRVLIRLTSGKQMKRQTHKCASFVARCLFYPSNGIDVTVCFLWCFSFSVFCVCLHLSIGSDIKCLGFLNQNPILQPESKLPRRRPKCQASERSVPSELQTLRVQLIGLKVPIPMPSMCRIFTCI